MNRIIAILCVGLSLMVVARGYAEDAPATEAKAPSKVKPAELIKGVSPSLVQVHFWLQTDQGQEPYGSGWATRCPNCGNYHLDDTAKAVPEERPVRIAGFLVAPDLVITTDMTLNPRFLKSIAVQAGGESVGAKVAGWYTRENAMLLKLDKPLATAKPLSFEPADGPYYGITYVYDNGSWQTTVASLSTLPTLREDGSSFMAAPSRSLIVSSTGTPVTLAMNDELPADDSWKTSPLKWEMIDSAAMDKRQADLHEKVNDGLLFIKLTLRSPRATGQREYFNMGNREEQDTERLSVGVLTDPTTLLAIKALKPTETARLEKIMVTLADGKQVEAKFKASLKDYDAFVATLPTPQAGVIEMSTEPIFTVRNRLLMEAELLIQGENRVFYEGHRRVAGFTSGWRGQIYPTIAGEHKDRFLFDDQGKLVVMPLGRREPVTEPDRFSMDRNDRLDTSIRYIAPLLSNLPANSDPANVPLSETDENRLAWLGVELQPMNPELARINKVAQQTNDGESGAAVTYVYPESPAAKAGIKAGDVILRVHTATQPKPIEIKVQPFMFDEQPFPWDRYQTLPEQYFDQVPRPWPAVESPLTRALTNIGFEKEVELEYASDGNVKRLKMGITQSPPHFDTAERAKSEAMGITVRQMTYEVRKFFQRKPEDPGVIISKIEIGSVGSKAGLKPFEFITHVNDQPVNSIADFQKLTQGGGDLQLSVRRNTRNRVVKISLSGSATQPAATQPTTTGPAPEPAAP